MKIAIDISQIVYGTGVSSYTGNLAKNLLEVDKKNEYILFASTLRAKKRLKEFLNDLADYQNFNSKILSFPLTFLEILWNRLHVYPIDNIINEVDIFHSSDWLQPPILSPSTKKVTTIHDMIPYLFTSSVHAKIVVNQKRRLNLVKKQVDLIIADSQTTKEDIVKFLQIDPTKIRVVYLAASNEFKPQDEQVIDEVLAKYKIKKPYLLSVGTFEPRKNIQKLLDVFTDIVVKIPQLHLVLTGKHGWGSGYHHSGDNITWTGYVSQEDLVALYAGCRVFVYPSLYEGFGLPILEAMACGAPVITSNTSSMVEIAKDAAILVDPRSDKQLTKSIEFVMSLNLENYQKMVRASISRARQYSWTKTAKETLKVYEELGRRQKPAGVLVNHPKGGSDTPADN